MNNRTYHSYLPLLGGSYLIMIFSGSFNALRGALLPSIMDYYHISYSGGGIMFLTSIIPGMCGSLYAGYIYNIFGKKRVMLVGVGIIASALALMTISPVYGLFLSMVSFYTFGQTLTVTSTNMTINDTFDSVLKRFKQNGITMVHFAYSAGALTSLIVLWFIIDSLTSWRVPFLIICTLPLTVFCLLLVSVFPNRRKGATLPGKKEYLYVLGHSQFQRYILIAVLYAGAEAGIVNWLPTYMRDAMHTSASESSLMLLYFFVFFTAGRFLGTVLIQKFNRHNLFYFLTVMMVFTLSGSFLFDFPFVGLKVLLPVSGFFFAVVFPIIQMNMIDDFEETIGAATGLLFTSTSMGITVIPFLIGVVNDVAGVSYGILITLGAAGAMIPLYYFIVRWKRQRCADKMLAAAADAL